LMVLYCMQSRQIEYHPFIKGSQFKLNIHMPIEVYFFYLF
jgi:hypothetical protein